MLCGFCRREWTLDPGMPAGKCPFCGRSLPGDKSTMTEALRYILTSFGREAFLDGKRIYAMALDLAPGQPRELRMLQYLLECKGLLPLVDSVSQGRQQTVSAWVRRKMTEELLVSPSAAAEACEMVLAALKRPGHGGPVCLRARDEKKALNPQQKNNSEALKRGPG